LNTAHIRVLKALSGVSLTSTAEATEARELVVFDCFWLVADVRVDRVDVRAGMIMMIRSRLSALIVVFA
jgi:hypothetical protein